VKRRRRRTQAQVVAARALVEIRQRRRAFLREVSAILSDALGFTVKVSLNKPDRMAGLSPDQRRAARRTKKQNLDQIREAFAPFIEREP
jgi:hypothetical protein